MTTLTELPVWTLLRRASQDALLLRRGDTLPAAIAVAPDLSGDDVANVPLVATTRLMLERAHALGGLTLTATGALSRADVRAIFEAMEWPGYDKAHVLIMNRELNEADVMPVELTRLTAQVAKLLRKREKRLLATKVGQALAKRVRLRSSSASCLRQCSGSSTSATSTAYRSKHGHRTTPVSCSGACRWRDRSGSGQRI